MSIRVTYEFVCDFCGKSLDMEKMKLFNSPNFEWPKPRKLHVFHVHIKGQHLDLCWECQRPFDEAFDDRLAQLRVENRLVGIIND